MKPLTLAIAASTLLMVGCAKSGANFVGKWQGVRVEIAKVDENTSSEASKQAHELASEIVKLMTIEFKSDGTADFATMGLVQSGTYTTNGNSATFTAKPGGAIALQSQEPKTFTMSGNDLTVKNSDGSVLYFERAKN